MIGNLPKTLTVNGEDVPINSDYRAALVIFEALNDDKLSASNKSLTMLEILYAFNIPKDTNEAIKQAIWFLDIGDSVKNKAPEPAGKTIDYKQDEQLLFAAVNAVAGHDVREDEYMHWWTFYGWCQSISPESTISHIAHIRAKRSKGEKLEKHEQKYYYENRYLIDLQSDVLNYEEMVRALRGED